MVGLLVSGTSGSEPGGTSKHLRIVGPSMLHVLLHIHMEVGMHLEAHHYLMHVYVLS